MTNNSVLSGCERGCLIGDLIACPLSKEEQEACERRKGYSSALKDIGGLLSTRQRYGSYQGLTYRAIKDEEVEALERGESIGD